MGAVMMAMAILSGQMGWLADYRWFKVGNYTALTQPLHCVSDTLPYPVPSHLEALWSTLEHFGA